MNIIWKIQRIRMEKTMESKIMDNGNFVWEEVSNTNKTYYNEVKSYCLYYCKKDSFAKDNCNYSHLPTIPYIVATLDWHRGFQGTEVGRYWKFDNYMQKGNSEYIFLDFDSVAKVQKFMFNKFIKQENLEELISNYIRRIDEKIIKDKSIFEWHYYKNSDTNVEHWSIYSKRPNRPPIYKGDLKIRKLINGKLEHIIYLENIKGEQIYGSNIICNQAIDIKQLKKEIEEMVAEMIKLNIID